MAGTEGGETGVTKQGVGQVTRCYLHWAFSAHRRETECKQEAIAVEKIMRRPGR